MCRINNNSQYILIKQEKSNITLGGTVSVIIEDPIEGNKLFNVSIAIKEGGKSVTELNFKDEHTGFVTIINPNPDSNILPSNPMEVGTYKGDNKLFMDYKLYKQFAGEEFRQINIEFGILKKR